VDLGSVRVAPTPVLIRATIAAARNAQGLLYDAQVLAEAGCAARAYSLASLAVEESGKAASLVLLTVMPEAVRAPAPVGRLLEWHQLKQAEGLLIARMPYRFRQVGSWLGAMPAGELEQFMTALDAPTDEADRLKRRGLYTDVGRGGRIWEPSEITETEVFSQLARAEQATSAAGQLLEPETPDWLADPATELVELARAAVSALTEARCAARAPQAATNIMLIGVSKLQDHMAAKDATGTPVPCELRTRSTSHAPPVHHREGLTPATEVWAAGQTVPSEHR